MFEIINKRNKKSGLISASLYLVEYKDGKRRRRYIPVSQSLVAVQGYLLQTQKTLLRRIFRKAFEKGRRGRPPKIPHPQQELLARAGFHVHKNEIRRGRHFSTPEAAVMRFALLDEGIRKAVGSPEKLLEYERKSLSLMKADASKGIGTGFKACFEKLILQVCSCNSRPAISG